MVESTPKMLVFLVPADFADKRRCQTFDYQRNKISENQRNQRAKIFRSWLMVYL